jgi:hypothetical protein
MYDVCVFDTQAFPKGSVQSADDEYSQFEKPLFQGGEEAGSIYIYYIIYVPVYII